MPQHSEHPRDDQYEVSVGLDIEVGPQALDGASRLRRGQRLHARRAAKAHGWAVHDPPAVAVDLHRSPGGIGEVEIESVAQAGHAHIDVPFFGVEVCRSFHDAEHRLQRLRIYGTTGGSEERLRQPAPELLVANRPRLAMPVDVDVHETRALGRMEQRRRIRQLDQGVSLRWSTPRRFASRLGNGFVERRDPNAGIFESRAQTLEGAGIITLQRSQN